VSSLEQAATDSVKAIVNKGNARREKPLFVILISNKMNRWVDCPASAHSSHASRAPESGGWPFSGLSSAYRIAELKSRTSAANTNDSIGHEDGN
jgi:hypothetical protein